MSDRHTSELSSKKSSLLNALNQLWHLPDNFHWMSPLPNVHRRWLVFLFIIITILLLLPTSKQKIVETENRAAPLQAALVIDGYHPYENVGTSPVQFVGNRIRTDNDEEGTWKTLQIHQGQSLTQIFHSNNLTAEDALALIKVEGDERPLSSPIAGQKIKVKLDNANRIVAVDVEIPGKDQAFFIRQPGGEFFRYQ